MKAFVNKATSLLLTICIVIPLAFGFFSLKVEASESLLDNKQSLSSVRKTYVSSDNTGYTSTTDTSVPFGIALTDLLIGSSTMDGLNFDFSSSKGVPVVRLNNASDLVVGVKFADKTKGDTLHSWKKAKSEYENVEPKTEVEIAKKYLVSSDSWGEKQTGSEKQTVTVNGLQITTGKISTGTIVIQTSADGVHWNNVSGDKYANGLYTTDVLNYYHGTTQSYTIDGQAIKQGTYVSVSFLYEVEEIVETYSYKWVWYTGWFNKENKKKKETYETKDPSYINVCETYEFFVIEDNPDVVTFNNLTTADKTEIISAVKPSSKNPVEYAAQAEQYNAYVNAIIKRILPTMFDGDMTTTGFRINVTANPYLKVLAQRNGEEYTLPQKIEANGQVYYEIKDSGKYDITVISETKFKSVTLYVDSVTPNEAYTRYFGESVEQDGQKYGDRFIDYSADNPHGNVRSFDSYSKIPVFIGTLTLDLGEGQNENVPPLYGFITNKSTGTVTEITNRLTALTECGEYEALFYTNKQYYDAQILSPSNTPISGDVRVYRFKFKLVESGSDTTVNEQLLSNGSFKDLSVTSPSDYAPRFYGVTRTSANKGKIIVAFNDKASALKYAREVAWSEIESFTDDNGNAYWRIPNLDNPIGAKVISYSGWQNAQVVNTLAERMVEELYFDMTKAATYLTLEKSAKELEDDGIALTDLQLESLTKSVIIWYNAEHRKNAIAQDKADGEVSVIKYIGRKSTAILSKDENGKYSVITTGVSDYVFIKDVLGIDSNTLTALGASGNAIDLKYGEGVYAQLERIGCESGLISITETNIYGVQVAKYNLYYIAEGYQPAKLSLTVDAEDVVVTSESETDTKTCQRVVINDVTDLADTYSYIRINGEYSDYYSIEEAKGLEITASGEYEIAVIDRFGNAISFKFIIV